MSDKNLYPYINGPAYKLIFDAGVRREILKLITTNSGGLASVADYASLPVIGDTGITYVTEDNGLLFYWDRSAYQPMGGGSSSSFTILIGTVWNGSNKELTLTGNVVLTTTDIPAIGGLLMIHQDGTGSHTITLNGTSLPVTSTANSTTIFRLDQTSSGSLFGIKDTSYFAIAAPPPPDTTPPTLFSATATDLHTIQATMSEAVTGTIAGWSATVNGGSPITPDSISGTTTRSLVFSETFLDTDTILLSYNAGTGDTVDTATIPNVLASITSYAVTNSISAPSSFLTLASSSGVVESPSHYFTFASDGYMLFTETMSGNGRVYSEIVNQGVALALDNTNSFSIPTTVDALVFTYGGGLYASTGTYSPINLSTSAVVGHFMGLRKNGSTIYVEISSDAVTWTTIYTFLPTFSATTNYVKGILLDNASAGTAALKNVKGF